MPCSGPRAPCAFRSASSASAIAQRVGIDFDDRAQRRPAAIDRLDALQIQLGQLPRRVAPARHPVLQLRGGRFFERERRRSWDARWCSRRNER